MVDQIKKVDKFKKKEDFEEFAKYLGVDYEDLYELNYKKTYFDDIDFDDYSR